MGYKQFCKEPEKIENYEKAKKDNFKGWECHHRLETHTSDGKRRAVDIPQKELIALGMYYNRPASELIFLTTREHNAFRRGRKRSVETKKKLREARKGKKFSEEHKKKLGEAHKGKKFSDETRRRMSESHKGKNIWSKGNTNTKGMRWYNNGKINTMSKECPPGFVPGRLHK